MKSYLENLDQEILNAVYDKHLRNSTQDPISRLESALIVNAIAEENQRRYIATLEAN